MSKKGEDMLKDNKISEMLCASKLNDLLKKCEDKDDFKIKGDLLTSYIYSILVPVYMDAIFVSSSCVT